MLGTNSKILSLIIHMSQQNSLPTLEDILPDPFDLDQQSAAERFLGKNLDEAYEMFCEDYFRSMLDFYFIGEKAFIYYLPVITRYLKSESIYRDEVLSVLDSIIGFRSKTFWNHPIETNEFIKEFREAKFSFAHEDKENDEDGSIKEQFEKVDLSIEVFLLLPEARDEIKSYDG